MTDENTDNRLRRLEIAILGQTDRLTRLEQKTFGASGVMKPETQTTATNVTTTIASGASAMGGVPPVVSESRQKAAADALIDMGGSNPNVKAPPRRRQEEPRRPIPKKQTQSHYGGWVDQDGKPLLDKNGNLQIFNLNFAQRAWGFFKSARTRLRKWSRGIRSRENKFLYLDITLREIIDDLEEQNDAIDTRLIIEAVEALEDFLKPLSRQDGEIDGTWKIVHFIRGLFE